MTTEATWRGKRYVPINVVARRYGVSQATIERLDLPRPMRVRGRLYWDEAELDAWDQARGPKP